MPLIDGTPLVLLAVYLDVSWQVFDGADFGEERDMDVRANQWKVAW